MLRRLAILLVYRGLLGVLFAALWLSPPAQAQSSSASAELATAASPQPKQSRSQPRTGSATSGVVADLLGLITQIKPLRVTVPYVDYHDQALAAQTKHHRLRRQAGLGRLTARRPSYDAPERWSNRQPSNSGGRSALSGSEGDAPSEGSRDSAQSR